MTEKDRARNFNNASTLNQDQTLPKDNAKNKAKIKAGTQPKIWTILPLIKETSQYFQKKGIEKSRLDAEVLLSHILDISRVDIYLQFDRSLSSDELEQYRGSVRRRAAHEPVAYIIGEKEFYSLTFKVDERVLIPRPETEHLVEETIRLAESLLARSADADKKVTILDLGTGSGAVALTLAHEIPEAEITASDISSEALALALENAVLLDIKDRVVFIEGDLLEPFSGQTETIDFITANLPYVPADDLSDLSPEVRDFEPRLALEAGPDGLDLISRVIPSAFPLLKPGGALLLEIAPEQADQIKALGMESGFHEVKIVQDLTGRDRLVILVTPC